jgi:hypothetical protein
MVMIRSAISTLLLVCSGFFSFSQEILVQPYLQPGNASSLTKEMKVLIWQTDSIPGKFKVEISLSSPNQKVSEAKISITKLCLNNKTSLLYRASLNGLKFDATYRYKVYLNEKRLMESTFNTRTKNQNTRFAVLGDCGAGTVQQAQIANQIYQNKPEFVLVTGDNVYQRGLENEYRKNFFPYYNSPEANPEVGAPLMKSIPFYLLIGNHDVFGADLDKTPDGLAYFYYSDLPLNGPTPESVIEPTGAQDLVKAFKSNTKPRYPKISNYSFDQGNVHIACLDANSYTNPLDPNLIQWLAEDLRNSKADWKIVTYHHPGFNSSKAHYDYQYMRLLSPVFEQLGVDLVLTGHVHNYQRSVPLTFDPKKNEAGTQYVITEEGHVDGKFTLDEVYDGVTTTKPKGIIYIVSGAGGAPLYDNSISGKPELWKHEPPENWVPFTKKLVSDINSFTLIETEGKKLTLKQLDAQGVAFDQIIMTK